MLRLHSSMWALPVDWRAQGPHASTPGAPTLFSSLVASSRWIKENGKRRNMLLLDVFIGWWWRMAACKTGVCWHLVRGWVREWDGCICRWGFNGEHSLRLSQLYTFKQEIKLSCWNIICSVQIYSLFSSEMHEGRFNTVVFSVCDCQMVLYVFHSLL